MAIEAKDRSLFELEREAERTRAGLINTVDELHNRVSPQAIKREMRSYAREASQDLIHNLQRRAKEYPLQTVAFAVGLAYPAWRFVANIPAPILLIGAGLALSQSGARSPKGVSRDLGADTDGRTVQDGSSQVADRVENVKERATAAVGEAAAAARSRVTELSERAGAAVSDASTSVTNAAAESLAAVRETVSGSYQAGVQALSGNGEQLSEMMENHPFVVGGIGLLIGAAIASVLPVSQAENRIMGDSSDVLKKRVRDLASEGVNAAAATAQSVYQDSASRVQKQGLSSDSVREIVKNVGDKVKEAAHQAADAMAKENDQSPVR